MSAEVFVAILLVGVVSVELAGAGVVAPGDGVTSACTAADCAACCCGVDNPTVITGCVSGLAACNNTPGIAISIFAAASERCSDNGIGKP